MLLINSPRLISIFEASNVKWSWLANCWTQLAKGPELIGNCLCRDHLSENSWLIFSLSFSLNRIHSIQFSTAPLRRGHNLSSLQWETNRFSGSECWTVTKDGFMIVKSPPLWLFLLHLQPAASISWGLYKWSHDHIGFAVTSVLMLPCYWSLGEKSQTLFTRCESSSSDISPWFAAPAHLHSNASPIQPLHESGRRKNMHGPSPF